MAAIAGVNEDKAIRTKGLPVVSYELAGDGIYPFFSLTPSRFSVPGNYYVVKAKEIRGRRIWFFRWTLARLQVAMVQIVMCVSRLFCGCNKIRYFSELVWGPVATMSIVVEDAIASNFHKLCN